jgi:hypothetical protein
MGVKKLPNILDRLAAFVGDADRVCAALEVGKGDIIVLLLFRCCLDSECGCRVGGVLHQLY